MSRLDELVAARKAAERHLEETRDAEHTFIRALMNAPKMQGDVKLIAEKTGYKEGHLYRIKAGRTSGTTKRD